MKKLTITQAKSLTQNAIRFLSVSMCAIFMMLTLTACTQHHALNTKVTHDSAFYGGSDLRSDQNQRLAELPVNEQVKTTYASSMACQAVATLDAPYHFDTHNNNAMLVKRYAQTIDVDTFQAMYNASTPLSPGDMIELSLINGDGFAGNYIINQDGHIQLSYIPAIKASGLSTQELSEQIELALVRGGLFQPNSARTGVRVLQWAPIEVSVSGAVFQAGRVLINQKLPTQVIEQRVTAFGDYAPTRYLSEALRAASGIRPDARIDKVLLIRDSWQIEVDLSGVITGMQVNDIALVAGDQVIVPTTGCFQSRLVQPSQITPKGFRVFMSNLIETAKSNANAAIGGFSSNLPYGSRLLQAAVSANCVGGTSWTNAPRKIMLASNNPLTGKTEVVERSVEKLIRQADNDLINPYLMPNDAVACYDSDVTNLRDLGKSLVDIISPIKLL